MSGEVQLSRYEIVPVPDPAAMRTMLAAALGTLAEVRKERTLLMRANVRLHLDRVAELGDSAKSKQSSPKPTIPKVAAPQWTNCSPRSASPAEI